MAPARGASWPDPAPGTATMTVLSIDRQPDDTTCGPTALHAVYRFYGERLSLEDVIDQVPALEGGGTLGVLLANHALARGYTATIYTYNLRVFDPSWFAPGGPDIRQRLRAQLRHKKGARTRQATAAYLEFLDRGGQLRYEDLTPSLLRRPLKAGTPLLTGLSATYLYRTAREHGATNAYDDVRGEPSGHFVVLTSYHAGKRTVSVADPLLPNPMAPGQHYEVSIHRLVGAILLGVLTHDANLLVIRPGA